LLVTVLDGSPVLLRNQSANKGHWLRIKTVGKKSNRDGLGARIEVTAGGLKQSAEVRANSSFESASDPRLHFGLGAATQVDSITVHWPSGSVDRIAGQAVDQELVIEEGSGVVGRRGPETVRKPVAERQTRRLVR
jgi:enediyne biosynthesis protein E4